VPPRAVDKKLLYTQAVFLIEQNFSSEYFMDLVNRDVNETNQEELETKLDQKRF